MRRRAPGSAFAAMDLPDEPDRHERARVALRAAAAHRRRMAEQALRSGLRTASGQCVVDALVAPWLLRHPESWHDAGPLPPPDVLLGAFRLLQDDPPVTLVEEFVAAEPAKRRGTVPPPSPGDEQRRFIRGRTGHAAGWRLPDGLDPAVLAGHALVAERLGALDAVATRLGTPLPVDAVLANPRWWPGRQAEPHAFGSRLYGVWRRAESFSWEVEWIQAFHDAQDLLYEAAGLPELSPEAWVVAATGHVVPRFVPERP